MRSPRNMSASCRNCSPTHRRWAGPSSKAPDGGQQARLAGEIQTFGHGRRPRPRFGPGASRDLDRWPPSRLQAAISRHEFGGRGRSAAVEDHLSASTSATTAPSPPARSTARSPTVCARSSTIGSRRGIWRYTGTCWPGKSMCTCRNLLDLTTKRLLTMTWIEGEPLMQFLEGKPSIDLRNKVAAEHVPRLVRAVLRLRRHSRRPHLAITRCAPRVPKTMATSICWISAASHLRADLRQGVIVSTSPCSTTTANSPSKPAKAGASPSLNAGDRCPQSLGAFRLWPAAGRPLAPDPGNPKAASAAARGRRRRPRRSSASGASHAAKGIRLHGPRRHRFGSVFLRLKAEINWYELFTT